jgi:glutathione synthase/RimK-type ligase-like ATP-grasp enzyme
MILIITHKEDFTADFVIEKLNTKKISYLRLNCEDIFNDEFALSLSTGVNLSINKVDNFDSVWFRRTKLPDIKTNNKGEKLFLLGDFESLFDNLFQVINAKKWLSNPYDVYRAENKLLQLKVAESLGFSIPKTIITNDYTKLKEFIKYCNNKVIIKPIRQGRIELEDGTKTIFTNIIDEDVINRLDEFELTPSIIQNYISKKYELRITVVGDKVFSVKIDSQKNKLTEVDWRREKLPMEEVQLPNDIEEKCKRLLKELNISFGAIDIIVDKNGNYIFLEINPNGQWAWIEMETSLKISDAIINFLTDQDD